MLIGIIQSMGVLLFSFFGVSQFLNAMCAKDWNVPYWFIGCIGLAMSFIGLFF